MRDTIRPMSEIGPMGPVMLAPVPRDKRMRWTVLASLGLHVLIFGVVLLPRLPLAAPEPPAPVNVDIVTPKQLSSLEASSSEASSAPPSASSSAEATSSQAPSSQAASSAETSSAASEAASSVQPPSTAASSEEPPKLRPTPKSGRVIVPVGPADSSSEAASSATSASDSSDDASSGSEASSGSSAASASAAADAIASLLAAEGGASDGAGAASRPENGATAASAPDTSPPPPIGGGKLHSTHRFYLKEMLASPTLSQAKAALKQLTPQRRLAQTCNIEATGQAGGAGYVPDAIIANAFAAPAASGTSYSVSGGAFRADGRWYRIAYDCTLNADMSDVASFSFHIGDDVTAEMEKRLGGKG